MKVSVNLTNYSWPGGAGQLAHELSEVVRTADDIGLDTVWVSDHLLQADPTATADQTEMLEAYTTLGFLAGISRRVNLGTMVSAVSFRPPALLIKAVTTLDVLSRGRAWLGIGAGYHNQEAEAMGLPMPATADRFEQLEDTLKLAFQMWRGDASAFAGSQVRAAGPVGSPLPLSRPHPRVLIGGAGEQKTLRLVAQYADACNLFDIPDGGKTVKHKLEVLAHHCADLGRPYDAIEKTLSTRLNPGESSEQFAGRSRTAAEWGIQHLVVITPGPWTDERLRALAASR